MDHEEQLALENEMFEMNVRGLAGMIQQCEDDIAALEVAKEQALAALHKHSQETSAVSRCAKVATRYFEKRGQAEMAAIVAAAQETDASSAKRRKKAVALPELKLLHRLTVSNTAQSQSTPEAVNEMAEQAFCRLVASVSPAVDVARGEHRRIAEFHVAVTATTALEGDAAALLPASLQEAIDEALRDAATVAENQAVPEALGDLKVAFLAAIRAVRIEVTAAPLPSGPDRYAMQIAVSAPTANVDAVLAAVPALREERAFEAFGILSLLAAQRTQLKAEFGVAIRTDPDHPEVAEAACDLLADLRTATSASLIGAHQKVSAVAEDGAATVCRGLGDLVTPAVRNVVLPGSYRGAQEGDAPPLLVTFHELELLNVPRSYVKTATNEVFDALAHRNAEHDEGTPLKIVAAKAKLAAGLALYDELALDLAQLPTKTSSQLQRASMVAAHLDTIIDKGIAGIFGEATQLAHTAASAASSELQETDGAVVAGMADLLRQVSDAVAGALRSQGTGAWSISPTFGEGAVYSATVFLPPPPPCDGVRNITFPSQGVCATVRADIESARGDATADAAKDLLLRMALRGIQLVAGGK